MPRGRSPLQRVPHIPLHSRHHCTENKLVNSPCPNCKCHNDDKNGDKNAIKTVSDDAMQVDQEYGVKRKHSKSSGRPISDEHLIKKLKSTCLPGIAEIRRRADEAAIRAITFRVPPGLLQFCLVSLRFAEADCVETCRVVPTTISEDHLEKLEFAWGLHYGTLYLNSRYNLMSLTRQLRKSFDLGSWALVPLDCDHLMSLLSTFTPDGKWRELKRDKRRMIKLYDKAKSFRYALLPLPIDVGLKSALIRRNERTWMYPPSLKNPDALHYFPYATLPVLTSHIRPHFVIYDLGNKLEDFKIKVDSMDDLVTSFPVEQYQALFHAHPGLDSGILLSSLLYQRWVSERPPVSFFDCSKDDASVSTASVTSGNKSEVGGDHGKIDDEIYPEDSNTLAPSGPGEGQYNDLEGDDEYPNSETDSCFYDRINQWVENTVPGLEPPTSPGSSSPVREKDVIPETGSGYLSEGEGRGIPFDTPFCSSDR
ncbi:hypothetical protein BDZ97DRAFT_1920064 [Flammula alnicola]|nr:hypothetical protein BDZ97DRAFT_1920064 [Flammula alnicola]